jgi:hypothetical protein
MLQHEARRGESGGLSAARLGRVGGGRAGDGWAAAARGHGQESSE